MTVERPATEAELLQWAEALESGNYKQTFGTLISANVNNGFSYCCLGVAKEIFVLDQVSWDFDVLKYEVKLYGLIKKHFIFLDALWQEYFYTLNDNDGYSFKDIAEKVRLHAKDIVAGLPPPLAQA